MPNDEKGVLVERGEKPVTGQRNPPATVKAGIGSSLSWAALVAAGAGCGVPLVQGLISGWPAERTAGYLLVAVLYLLLTQIEHVPLGLARRLANPIEVYLVVIGLVCLLLQAISADPFIQPIVFTVPFVRAALSYGAGRSALIAGFYLALMAIGIRLAGMRRPEQVLIPLASYGALMVFMYNSSRLIVSEAAARQRADRLAADLAQERDHLQRLATITATLTRNLEPITVLEQVAAAGRALARAGEARVWLREPGPGDDQTGYRLAAVVPPMPSVALDEEQPAPPAAEDAPAGDRLMLPLRAKGAAIGRLELRDRADEPFGVHDTRLLQPFADAAAVAIENARLYEQARLSATLAERNRLARELHDTIAQGLTAVTMQLEAAQRSFERDPARTRTRLGRAHELARATLEDVRRSVWTLASPLVDGDTLDEALDELTARFAARTGVEARYEHYGPAPKLDHAAATQVLRIVQEALQNVEKHARATDVEVRSETAETLLRVSVRDNGKGFEASLPATGHPAWPGFGLHSLHERARLAGGRLAIQAAPGAGTCVEVSIPIA